MIYYINKKTLDVYVYDSKENAEKLNSDFINLIECDKPIDSQYRIFNFDDMKWEIDVVAQNEDEKKHNIAFLNYEEDRTEDAITKLKRVVDRNIATEEELKRFDTLEIYSIQLMRVPNQETWPLNPVFPTCPDFFSE